MSEYAPHDVMETRVMSGMLDLSFDLLNWIKLWILRLGLGLMGDLSCVFRFGLCLKYRNVQCLLFSSFLTVDMLKCFLRIASLIWLRCVYHFCPTYLFSLISR